MMGRWTPHLCLLSIFFAQGATAKIHRFSQPMMGTDVVILIANENTMAAQTGANNAFDELRRLDARLSEWRSESELSKVNQLAHQQAVQVGADLFVVLRYGMAMGQKSQGAFDMSWAGLKGLWQLRGASTQLPTSRAITAALARVDYRAVELNAARRTVRFRKPQMVLGLGGVAKGYAIDSAARALLGARINHFVVSVGGDMLAHGTRLGKPWSAGIQHPRKPKNALLARVALDNESLATSGDYERYAMVNGVRYHHILDPRTGRPAQGIMSVSVLAQSAMAADALCTSAFVMGMPKGLALLEAEKGVDGLLVDSQGTVHMTSGAKRRFKILVDPVVQ